MGKQWIVNSERTRDLFIDEVIRRFDEDKYTIYEYKDGTNRTLSQNALFHIWLTEYAAHICKIDKKDVCKDILNAIKKKVKQTFYQETGQAFIVKQNVYPWAPEKLVLTSSAKWASGEMHMVMDWLQAKAAEKGLILESKGEYQQLKEKQT